MNVADKDLCKELFGLSGWKDTYFEWFENAAGEWLVVSADVFDGIPAYDLGYLLRKLPPNLNMFKAKSGTYRFRVDGIIVGGVTANSPEDSACALAIELLKNDYLTKRSSDE